MARAILLVIVMILAWPISAWAYIDPGTGGYVYSMVAPLLALAAGGVAFVFRPVRRLFGQLFSWLKPGKPKA